MDVSEAPPRTTNTFPEIRRLWCAWRPTTHAGATAHRRRAEGSREQGGFRKLAASVIGEAVWDALLESGTVHVTDVGRGRGGGLFSVEREAVSGVVQSMNSGLATESVGRALERL